jgi:hypothetical protein
MFTPMKTSNEINSFRKTLLYAHHGWGKTTQAKYMQRRYGKGFLLSGESGLQSIISADIDFLPFTSWDGVTDPAQNLYSFKQLFAWIRSPDFASRGYKWIMVDSLTELSDHAIATAQAEAEIAAKSAGKKVNGFDVWSEYAATMIGVCKVIRDLPMHVVVSALARESEDGEGSRHYWPMVSGKQVQQQLAGIFDCVLCGIRASTPATDGTVRVERSIATDEVSGWHGKVRDEKRVLKPIERTHDITVIFDKIDGTTTTNKGQ